MPELFSRDSRSGRRGFAVVYCALLSFAIAGMVGLAIDGSATYLVRLKLSQAADAAVLAGARSLGVDMDVNSQAATAIGIAQKFFDANLALGQWGITSVDRRITVTEDDTTHVRIVRATASAVAPLYFLSALNRTRVQVTSSAEARRRDVNVMLVLDRSGSMVRGNAIDFMKSAAQTFVNQFASGRDQVGLVAFSGTFITAFPPSTSFKTASPNVTTLISQMAAGGSTGTAQAIWAAYQALVAKGGPGALNVILLFTDGNPTAFTADFNPVLRTDSSCASRSTPKLGFIADYNDGHDPGVTAGVLDTAASDITDASENKIAGGSTGCAYASNLYNMRNDIAGMPAQDYYGNKTTGYLSVDLTRVDLPSQIQSAAKNAADDAARRIRQDANLTPVIYVIGLGGTGSLPPDEVFMKRVANDPSSNAYSAAEATGLYVFSPSAAQLNSAFQRIASEILRLSQ